MYVLVQILLHNFACVSRYTYVLTYARNILAVCVIYHAALLATQQNAILPNKPKAYQLRVRVPQMACRLRSPLVSLVGEVILCASVCVEYHAYAPAPLKTYHTYLHRCRRKLFATDTQARSTRCHRGLTFFASLRLSGGNAHAANIFPYFTVRQHCGSLVCFENLLLNANMINGVELHGKYLCVYA